MLTAAQPMPLATRLAQQSRALRCWLQAHRGAVAMAGLLAFAGPMIFFTGALSVMRSHSFVDVARLGLWWLLYGLALWGLLLAAGHACERLAGRFGRTPGAAIWLMGACAAAALASLLTAGRVTMLIEQGLAYSAQTAQLNAFIVALIMALLYFAHLRRSREHEQAAARLAAAQAAQRQARRRTVQARLQEVQARVDPQLLFELLDAARRLYDADAARAERYLDEMIVFLRAALPRLRSASSSLLREVELASALVGMRVLAGAPGGAMTIDVAPDVLHARFPPGVLLPLLTPAAGGGADSCRLAAMRSADGCRLLLQPAGAPAEASIARVRSLLAELYGAAGRLAIEGADGAMRIIIEVPYELA